MPTVNFILENLLVNQQILIQLARFIITLGAGVILTRLLLMPATKRLLSRRRDEKTLQSIVNIVGLIGLFFSLTLALQAGSFGNLTTVIGTIAAALTVAVGFGMRDQVGNLVSGVFIHFDNPFLTGDYIKSGEVEGVVKEINLRDTVMNGAEKTVVPNSTLMNNPLKNYTKGRRTKTNIKTEIETEKLEEKTELLKQSAIENSKVLEKPEPEIVFKELSEKMNVELNYWIKDPGTSKQIRSEVLEEYNRRLKEKGLLEKEEAKES